MGIFDRPKGGDISTYNEANEQFNKADRDAARTSALISAQDQAKRAVDDLKVVRTPVTEQD